MIRYGLLLKESWKDLTNNIIVFFPILVSIVLFLTLGMIIVLEIFTLKILGFTLTKASLTSINFLVALGIIMFIDFILLLLIIAVVKGSEARIFNLIVNNKKADSGDAFTGIKQFTGIFFRLEVIKLLIIFLPLILLGLIGLLGFLVSKGLGIGLLIIFGIIGLLYLIAALVILGFGLFFVEPLISTGKTNSAVEGIKQSLGYTKDNLGHVLLTWLIVAGFNIALYLIFELFSLPFLFFPLIYIVLMPIYFVLNIVVGTWLRLFIFNSYFNSKLKKV